MVDLLIDTNIVIDLLRDYQPTSTWLYSLDEARIGISSIVYMEVVQGATNKRKQLLAVERLSQFEIVRLNDDDQIWATKQLTKFSLSHNVDLADALIASSAYRLDLPIYTRNIKHFAPMLPDLVRKPY